MISRTILTSASVLGGTRQVVIRTAKDGTTTLKETFQPATQPLWMRKDFLNAVQTIPTVKPSSGFATFAKFCSYAALAVGVGATAFGHTCGFGVMAAGAAGALIDVAGNLRHHLAAPTTPERVQTALAPFTGGGKISDADARELAVRCNRLYGGSAGTSSLATAVGFAGLATATPLLAIIGGAAMVADSVGNSVSGFKFIRECAEATARAVPQTAEQAD